MSSCAQPIEPLSPLTIRLEGVKLGQRAVYSCPVGYTIDGVPNATCLASGNLKTVQFVYDMTIILRIIYDAVLSNQFVFSLELLPSNGRPEIGILTM